MALITGLLLLAAISLLALAGTSGMILQRHMSSNFLQASTALQNAELAQSEGQAWLFSRANHEREADCIRDCLLPVGIFNSGTLPVRVEHESTAWWQLNGIESGIDPVTGTASVSYQDSGADTARWIIEEVHFESVELPPPLEQTQGIGYYRIFGRGSGGNSRNVAVTEAIIARPWGIGFVADDYPPPGGRGDFCQQTKIAVEPVPACGLLAWRQRR